MKNTEAILSSEDYRLAVDRAHALRAIEIKRLFNSSYTNVNQIIKNLWSNHDRYMDNIIPTKPKLRIP